MKKILIIEDSRSDFEKMRRLLGGTYHVLPERFEEMSACIEYPNKVDKSIAEFVEQQIDDSYREIGLILCDIKFGDDIRGGNKVVKAIRNHKIPDAPNWTWFVPIIAVTNYADRQEYIIADGADFLLNKKTIESGDGLLSAVVEKLIEKFENLLNLQSVPQINKGRKDVKKVFIVHGHDDAIKQEVARTMEHLKLKPIILHEQANQGRTIIEKFEANGSDVGFAIILLTADDVGRLKTEGGEDNKPRARQNVVFEMGYFMSLLSRSHVVVLYEENVELPSDISGILYIPYNKGWELEIVKELKACGYNVSADDLS